MVISIWGFMGSGKSTLGQYMHKSYDWQHIDSDLEIEILEKRTINAIFAAEGEDYFRYLETKYLQQLLMQEKMYAKKTKMILTTGGGMPLRSENRKILAKLGPSIFLHVPFQEISRRLAADEERPLWDPAQLEAMRAKYEQRLPVYQQADYFLETEGKELEQMAVEINTFLNSI